MKTVFIVNPKAGQGKNTELLINKINETANILELPCKVYVTKGVGDAGRFVEDYCTNFGPARFIACGGDGTLNEVLNGVIEFEDAEVGVIPIGTGNDFCRNFGGAEVFSHIEGQFLGQSEPCDAIRYTTYIDGAEKSGYCANMFNIGFDCNVADMTQTMKTKPLISGPMAYFVSILVNLIKKNGANLKIELDGQEKHTGPLLLTAIANGCYCGGGIKSNPLASVQDGLISVNIIKDVPRYKFVRLLPHYMKGTFLKLKNIEKIILSTKCKKIKLTPAFANMRLCIDGEITDAGQTEFEIVHNAFNFVLPLKKEEQVKAEKEAVLN